MTERGVPLADGAPACPFVAFEDDRDERASVPDHRHRCYAESRPAPRALAHQEAYCLSSAFPVCPTFQDWARREAARTRGAPNRDRTRPRPASDHEHAAEVGLGMAAAAAAATARGSDASGGDEPVGEGGPHSRGAGPLKAGGPVPAARTHGRPGTADDAGGQGEPRDDLGLEERDGRRDGDGFDERDRDQDDDDRYDDDPGARRNPPRDWAAPPPWLASAERRGAGGNEDEPPAFVGRRATDARQGLAGSAADRLAGGPIPDDEDDSGGWVSSATAGAARAEPARRAQPTSPLRDDDGIAEIEDDEPRRVARRGRAYSQHLGGPNSPDWEQPRRYEAYPAIRTRVGMPQVPRLAVMAGIIALIAVALLLLPSLLNFGGTPAPAGSAAPSRVVASASVEPTVAPAPTPIVYTIKKGDTLSKVATRNGITLDELLKANPTIKNPNRVSEGQQIIIPAPNQGSEDAGGSAGASAAP